MEDGTSKVYFQNVEAYMHGGVDFLQSILEITCTIITILANYGTYTNIRFSFLIAFKFNTIWHDLMHSIHVKREMIKNRNSVVN